MTAFTCRVWTGCAFLALAGCGPGLDREAAIAHIREHRAQLEAARAEIVPRVPEAYRVEIELQGPDRVDLEVVPPPALGERLTVWNALQDGPDVARGLDALGWTANDLRRVRALVEELDGIGLRAPTRGNGIGLLYRRADDGWYTIFVTDTAVVSEQQLGYNGCASHWLDRRAGLVFASGAIGPVCMPGGDVTARY